MPGHFAAFLHLMRIAELAAEHLIAAANADDRLAGGGMLFHRRLHTAFPQPLEISQRVLGAGQDPAYPRSPPVRGG